MGKVAVIIPAAGRGRRARQSGAEAKQFRPLAGGASALARVIRLFRSHPAVSRIVVAAHPDDVTRIEGMIDGKGCEAQVVHGGETRQQSICNALQALDAASHDRVLVHDAARPFASVQLVDRAIASLETYEAAVPAIALTDTIVELAPDDARGPTLDRDRLRAVQTPQAFRTRPLQQAHEAAVATARDDFTDDGALMAWHGHVVGLFEGDSGNVKLTTAQDMRDAEQRLWAQQFLACPDVRTGTGFDVHACVDGDHVVLGGIAIPHTDGLSGHSDADVVLHALTDAILGALADGDIGAHFPPSDMRWKGQDSALFLQDAVSRVAARGGLISHLDCTIMCEAPKVGPHRDAMRRRIAEIAGLPLDRVAVKATTTERLGFTGRGEGIAAMATATLRLPFTSDTAN
ncbi:bifunctional enzyme IspD/IspF [Agaricicola taiwanensis]|uniref:Bifunctional enzyme IspD/IspF n=1 Tax=Agaricicola taiwanensis TaxID=591372 RepID=A0A8J3DVS9_9RHOB|nr:bifunctional 2-C-methyl-D-erythritol 4-phosphate cytidylyltransferase/2-C-methyl-D-erythritol 2,4-cyclodiphosphate synthase [Agaricicola taiwanensis]GGE45425.1 bifunctional enzyme IspD/IspF [Agaricicola taiwanensis]